MRRLFINFSGRISPLTLRLLAVNIGAVLMLAMGIFYSGRYEEVLIERELRALSREAQVVATLVSHDDEKLTHKSGGIMALRQMIKGEKSQRIVVTNSDGDIIVDSQPQMILSAAPVPPVKPSFRQRTEDLVLKLFSFLPTRLYLSRLETFRVESGALPAQMFPSLLGAFQGRAGADAWRDADGDVLLTAVAPLTETRAGAVLLMRKGHEVMASVRDVQWQVLQLFIFTLSVTTLLTLYLSYSIVRPLTRLARAAEKVQVSPLFGDSVPDLGYRQDEIGRLSIAFRSMTQALSERITAIDHFASDVAHEIKNPLASLRSAIETLALAKDDAARTRLMAILQNDVVRLTRLINDISRASRLDAETARAEKKVVDLLPLLDSAITNCLFEVSAAWEKVRLDAGGNKALRVIGNDTQLYQVIQNILSNALSFVTAEGTVDIVLEKTDSHAVVHIDNDGPEIPESKLEAIFARFYTERPAGEKFGEHSGLGLSISRQIAQAHGGSLTARNLRHVSGALKDQPRGVRFTIVLPLDKG